MQSLKTHEIPGRVTILTGAGGLPVIRVETDSSIAEILPYGAHVTRFQKTGESPLLFMSAASDFETGKPIRGGVPLVFPWFGGRDGLPAHGTARITPWDLLETLALPDGSIRLHFRLPAEDSLKTEFIVTVGPTLTMEFSVTNTGDSAATFETCMHTYFQIGDIHRIEVAGLQGTRYRDQVLGEEFTDTGEYLRFSGETDRVYQDTDATVAIHDPELRRTIRVHKSGSRSTVVWNPWIDKSKRMPDFGDDEYPQMVCVESGNVRENATTLAPGESSTLKVVIESEALA